MTSAAVDHDLVDLGAELTRVEAAGPEGFGLDLDLDEPRHEDDLRTGGHQGPGLVGLQWRQQVLQPVRFRDGVVVEQHGVLGEGLPERDVVAAGESAIDVRDHHLDARVVLGEQVS